MRLQEVLEDLFFRMEVVIDQRLRKAALGRDVGRRGGLETAGGKQLGRAVADPLLLFAVVFRPRTRHRRLKPSVIASVSETIQAECDTLDCFAALAVTMSQLTRRC